MATSTVIPDDIKTLKSDVSKLKNDQGSYATKLYVDSKDEIVGDWLDLPLYFQTPVIT